VIRVTRFNGTQIFINAELIQTVESTPDTVVTLINDTKLVVRESADEIVQRILMYRREAHDALPGNKPEKIDGS
jgi:flagellar protein FlbD